MSDSLVERLIRSADSWAPLAPTIARIEREAASALESLQAENERLKGEVARWENEARLQRHLMGATEAQNIDLRDACSRLQRLHQASASSDEPEETK